MYTVHFNGLPLVVETEIKEYFNRYSPYGYDTKIVYDYIDENGVRHVTVTRYGSD